MLYWERKRRLVNLQKFRDLVDGYFQTPLSKSPIALDLIAVSGARNQINLLSREAFDSCVLINEPVIVYYSSRIPGDYQGPLNLLQELFDLRDYQISPQKVTDALDRAIGEYGRRKKRLYQQMFNPFFWIKFILLKIVEVPFQVLGAMGFDSARIEKTAGGKFIKVIVLIAASVGGFVAFVAALMTILQFIGWLDPALKLIHITPRHKRDLAISKSRASELMLKPLSRKSFSISAPVAKIT